MESRLRSNEKQRRLGMSWYVHFCEALSGCLESSEAPINLHKLWPPSLPRRLRSPTLQILLANNTSQAAQCSAFSA